MGGLKDGLGGGTGTATASHEVTNDIIITGTNRIYFRDAGISLYSSADGKLMIASDGSSDSAIELAPSGGVSIKLPDKLGNNAFKVKDSDDFPVHSVDSKGNINYKGKTQRI